MTNSTTNCLAAYTNAEVPYYPPYVNLSHETVSDYFVLTVRDSGSPAVGGGHTSHIEMCAGDLADFVADILVNADDDLKEQISDLVAIKAAGNA